MELLALCTVLSMLPTGLICDLCTGTGSQAQSERNAAGRQQGNQPQSAMSAVPVVLHSAWSLLSDSGIRDAQ
jgi:hypothetical protein